VHVCAWGVLASTRISGTSSGTGRNVRAPPPLRLTDGGGVDCLAYLCYHAIYEDANAIYNITHELYYGYTINALQTARIHVL
jgi:hypothetical protein